MKQYIYSFLLCLLIHSNSLAQLSVFQDKLGETSIQTANNAIFINTGDASISFQIARTKRDTFQRTLPNGQIERGFKPEKYFGFNATFEASEGISEVVDDDKFDAGFELGGFYRQAVGQDVETPEGRHRSWYVALKYIRTPLNILESQTSPNFEYKLYNTLIAKIGYNKYGPINILRAKNAANELVASTYIYGVSIEYGKFNNVVDLNPVEQYSLITSGNTTSPQTVVIKDKKLGFDGPYYVDTGLRLSFDFYLFPKKLFDNRLGFGGNFRTVRTNLYAIANTSIGIILNHKQSANKIALGLFYQFTDFLSETEKPQKQTLNLIVGYKF